MHFAVAVDQDFIQYFRDNNKPGQQLLLLKAGDKMESGGMKFLDRFEGVAEKRFRYCENFWRQGEAMRSSALPPPC